MIRVGLRIVASCLLLALGLEAVGAEPLEDSRVSLRPEMVASEGGGSEAGGIVDEQDRIIGPPAGDPDSAWRVAGNVWKQSPDGVSATIDLGQVRNLSKLWIYDTNGKGDVVISVGKPGDWKDVATYDCGKYKAWAPIALDAATRYVRLTRKGEGANFSEVAIYEYTPEAWTAMLAKKEAEAKAAAERQAALDRAAEEMKKRPLMDVGAPFGKLYLIDEIDCATQAPEHEFVESPAGASRVETILGKPARVLSKTEGEAAYVSYRIGRMKLLQPGAAYVLEVEYPEDKPRSMVVMNGGSELSRGFHTGAALGDAMHPKYVANYNESLRVPLSGRYETWKLLFNLHDRTPNRTYIRGNGLRELTAEDGFTVTIAQFSARDIPMSEGAAVSRIRLYGVPDAAALAAKYTLPEGLPHRRLFWREEMADGVVGAEKEEERGLKDPLDWYRYKRNTMQFLGMNTYTKDLLEFGAVQHWDSTDGGGNDWAYFSNVHKNLWGRIVGVMGEAGFEIFPYYEYAGSKGKNGLGPQRRAKPLSRDDAYTHIKWIESANADITDPDTYEDFKKMLDLTVMKFKDKAKFVGAWLRPRSQLPMGFGDKTRERFAKEANGGKPVSRKELMDDKALLKKYEGWWYGKRREFLIAMRDHLRSSGIKDAQVLYTAVAAEPGVGFGSWEPRFVTDDPAAWQPIVDAPEHADPNRKTLVPTVEDVVRDGLYMKGLLAPPLTWGGWEVHYASPPSDPERYRDTEGVMLTHAFNRLYTVADPKTMDLFRTLSGLTLARHYSLNENMMFDADDKPKLGYFCADIERAGPYCMLAEASAMANGDPTQITYLSGMSYNRGFPEYVRSFNTAFLSLPALPSEIVSDASSDPDVVVRAIRTPSHGTYYAIVNKGMTAKEAVEIRLPTPGQVTDAPTGEVIAAPGGMLKLSMHPCQLRAVRVK